MGEDQSKDELLFTEEDELFWVDLSKSKTGKYVFLIAASSETYETHLLNLDDGKDAKLKLFQARKFGLRYDVTHHGSGVFLVNTNLGGAKNHKLMICNESSESNTGTSAFPISSWRELVPYQKMRQILDVEEFKDYLAIEGREDGLTQIWIADLRNKNLASPDATPLELSRLLCFC